MDRNGIKDFDRLRSCSVFNEPPGTEPDVVPWEIRNRKLLMHLWPQHLPMSTSTTFVPIRRLGLDAHLAAGGPVRESAQVQCPGSAHKAQGCQPAERVATVSLVAGLAAQAALIRLQQARGGGESPMPYCLFPVPYALYPTLADQAALERLQQAKGGAKYWGRWW